VHQSSYHGFGNACSYCEQPGRSQHGLYIESNRIITRIQGLVIKKTRTRAVTAEILATWKGQARPTIVDTNIIAMGAAETYSYLCALTKGSAYVRRVMSQ
jgi:hypothetical protein